MENSSCQDGGRCVVDEAVGKTLMIWKSTAGFPTRLNTLSDAPEPFRRALAKSLSSDQSIRLLVDSPGLAVLLSGQLSISYAASNETPNPPIEYSAFERGGISYKAFLGQVITNKLRSEIVRKTAFFAWY